MSRKEMRVYISRGPRTTMFVYSSDGRPGQSAAVEVRIAYWQQFRSSLSRHIDLFILNDLSTRQQLYGYISVVAIGNVDGWYSKRLCGQHVAYLDDFRQTALLTYWLSTLLYRMKMLFNSKHHTWNPPRNTYLVLPSNNVPPRLYLRAHDCTDIIVCASIRFKTERSNSVWSFFVFTSLIPLFFIRPFFLSPLESWLRSGFTKWARFSLIPTIVRAFTSHHENTSVRSSPRRLA